jgi:hypothetical protein
MTQEEREARRARNREYQRRHRARLSPAEIEARRARDRERYRALTPLQQERRLEALRRRHRLLSAERREKKRLRDQAWKNSLAGRASAALYKASVRKLVAIGRIITQSDGDRRPSKTPRARPTDVIEHARLKRDLAKQAAAVKRELLAIGRAAYGHRRGRRIAIDPTQTGADYLQRAATPIVILY